MNRNTGLKRVGQERRPIKKNNNLATGLGRGIENEKVSGRGGERRSYIRWQEIRQHREG